MAPAVSHAPSDALPAQATGASCPTGHGAPARIGPNAIIQVAHVLRDRCGAAVADPLLQHATGYTLATLPHEMVDEREARALSGAVIDTFGDGRARPMLHEAGVRTGDYLMAHRIPRLAQWVMRVAPHRVGLAILLKAMQQHAWTFAGSGRFTVSRMPAGTELRFDDCAMCRDMQRANVACDFYAGTFERLIRTLVTPAAQVREVECLAHGGQCCRFLVTGVH
jgi:divinyl protochlorophyllide a 8-vinyl-reductase